MGFVVGYAPRGLSPQIDGMPVIHETPCALAARGFFVLSVLLFFMEFILMWRVASCPKLLLDAYMSLMSPMIGSGSVLQCAAL